MTAKSIAKPHPDAVIITAWADTHGGPGWSNFPVHVLYRMPDGKLFEDYIQPDQQTSTMRELHAVSQAAHRSMTSAVIAALIPNRKASVSR